MQRLRKIKVNSGEENMIRRRIQKTSWSPIIIYWVVENKLWKWTCAVRKFTLKRHKCEIIWTDAYIRNG